MVLSQTRVAVRLLYLRLEGVLPDLRFTCKSQQNEEPTSGLEPLTCSLRVITQALQGCAGDCKSRISKLVSFLRIAPCCTVLRSRWYQCGIKTSDRLTHCDPSWT
jgi:hypothetical protein